LTGVRIKDLPLSAEKLRQQLKESKEKWMALSERNEPLHEGNMSRPLYNQFNVSL